MFRPEGSHPDRQGLLEWLEESRFLPVLFYATGVALIVVIGVDVGFRFRSLSVPEVILAIALAVPATFLLIASLSSVICYFVFIPSVSHDGHLFSTVHGSHLIHPLNTALVLGSAVLCLLTGSGWAWVVWGVFLAEFLLQTVLIVRRLHKEHLVNGNDAERPNVFFLLFNLILGTEIITVAAGAKFLPPWRLDTLPADTWIVDVRTKPEFHWNRLQAAESYPWGAGVVAAAKNQPKDRPVLVTCLSGHRSPAVACMLRRLGFKSVYNLNWGLLYLILLQRGKKTEGPFSLTRPHRDPYRRGEDIRGISIGYVTLQALILIIAPLENAYWPSHVSPLQKVIGAVVGIGGLSLGLASLLGLGRNFRVFAAPRRSGTLTTTGVYRWVRHPMYTGAITIFAGYILYFGSYLSVPLWLAFSILYLIKSVKEERILANRFPEYADYQKRTWKFIPFVY
jgi:protein-S-isoprenylcysteine O-methyltransferase Ste14/rhodanese-related sulfurtransferase